MSTSCLCAPKGSHQPSIASSDQQTAAWANGVAKRLDLVHRPDIVDDDKADFAAEYPRQMLFGRPFLDIMPGVVTQSFAHLPHIVEARQTGFLFAGRQPKDALGVPRWYGRRQRPERIYQCRPYPEARRLGPLT